MLKFTKPFYPLLLSAVKSDPETAHRQMLNSLTKLETARETRWGRLAIKQFQNSFCLQDNRLQQNLWGMDFPNIFGLAAGFDKDGTAAGIWDSFGFGFAELGAVTLHPQEGNPRPRMFRLPKDKAILNRMGANNDGAKIIASRLEESKSRKRRTIPIGINLCKSKITSLDDAAQDYVESFRYLRGWADYFVVNVSSPNTPGLRSLQAGEQLKPILEALEKANQGEKPILIKIAPDLTWEEIDAILSVSQEYNLSGVIATNTTTKRTGLKTDILRETKKPIAEESGGISGLPLKQRSTDVIRFIYKQTQGKLPIVGVGGIDDTESAWEKIIAGASLLQFYSGWVYQGPWVVKEILQGLKQKLEDHQLTNIQDAVGLSHTAR